MRKVLIVLALAIYAVYAQVPSSAQTANREQQEKASANRKNRPGGNERGSEQSPVVVKVLPTPKTKAETANEEAKELDQSSANWWMVRLTGAIVLVGLIQTIVFGVQARRLKQTIVKMDDISTQQTKDVQASITEATKASKAMEGIAESMATNVGSVKESVAINREIADRQKLITELQSRAYLVVAFEGMALQNAETRFKFEPRLRVVNRGNTPAYDIGFSARADVVDIPLSESFTFQVPEKMLGISGPIGPGLHKIISGVAPDIYPNDVVEIIKSGFPKRLVCWGMVKYRDAFDIDRFCQFGFTFYCLSDGKTWMAQDTSRNNDSD